MYLSKENADQLVRICVQISKTVRQLTLETCFLFSATCMYELVNSALLSVFLVSVRCFFVSPFFLLFMIYKFVYVYFRHWVGCINGLWLRSCFFPD